MNLSDQLIIENIKKKDEKTIYKLRLEYLPLVKYMVLNYKYSDGKRFVSAEQSDAEDLLHDALYILIKKITDGNFKLTSKLSSYFYAICKNLLKVKLNKKLHELEYRNSQMNEMVEVKEESQDLLLDKNLHKQAFDYYFKKLSKSCQDVLSLYWLEYSVSQISEKLGFTKNYIMKRKYECKNKLIKLVKENPENI